MPVFAYEILQSGKRERGEVSASDVKTAGEALRRQGATVLRLLPIKRAAKAADVEATVRFPRLEHMLRRGVRKLSVEQALRQMASMLDAGVPILKALSVTAGQHPGALERSLLAVQGRVRDGKPLAESLRAEAPYLSETALGLLEAGESNGQVPSMLRHAADLLEHRRQVRGMVVEAAVYPCIVIVIASGVGYFLVTRVIPKIIEFVQQHDANLPWVTQALVDVSNALNAYGPPFAAIALVTALGLFALRHTERYGRALDRMILRLPILGKLFVDSANSLWCRTLGVLASSGIDITRSLDLTAAVLWNKHLRREFDQVRSDVMLGRALAAALGKTSLARIAPLAHTMVDVGENAGTVDEGLLHASEFSEDALRRRIKLLAKLVEPAIFLVVGGMVAFVYIAFFMGVMAASRSILRH